VTKRQGEERALAAAAAGADVVVVDGMLKEREAAAPKAANS
jgi:hypothetical protein